MWQTKAEVSPEDWLILTQKRGLYISSAAAAANIAETERLQDDRYSARLLCSTERWASCRTESFNIMRLDSIANLSPFVTLTKRNLRQRSKTEF